MKILLLLAFLAGATAVEAAPAAPASTTQAAPGQVPMSKKEMKRKRKSRLRNGPEVYKGTVAEQSRIITDAAGSEKDKDGDANETPPTKKTPKQ